MATTGELIRLINYIDDIDTTLRRITAFVPGLDADERKRLAEHLRTTSTHFSTLLGAVEKGAQ